MLGGGSASGDPGVSLGRLQSTPSASLKRSARPKELPGFQKSFRVSLEEHEKFARAAEATHEVTHPGGYRGRALNPPEVTHPEVTHVGYFGAGL